MLFECWEESAKTLWEVGGVRGCGKAQRGHGLESTNLVPYIAVLPLNMKRSIKRYISAGKVANAVQ